MTKLILLDRDGVINYDSPDYVKSPAEWLPITSSIEAIADLTKNGHTIAIATNQSAVGRGYVTLEILNKIHNKMLTTVANANGKIDKIFFCPHTPNDNCNCRKPKPGLVLQALEFYNITAPSKVFFVGDTIRDLEAALGAKCTPVLVKTGNGKQTYDACKGRLKDIGVFANLKDFVSSIT